MDPSQPECQKCGLFSNSKQATQLPVNGQLAWSLFVDLSSPTVQRFKLTESILECYGLELSIREFQSLVDNLDAIDSGINEWNQENPVKHGT